MNSLNRTYKLQKIKGMIFSFLYIFVLLVTTFHHHPIDFAESKSQIKTIPTATSNYSFIAEECPIINFSQNGFNFTFTSNISTKLTLNKLQQIVLVDNRISKNRYRFSYSLRGPPFSII